MKSAWVATTAAMLGGAAAGDVINVEPGESIQDAINSSQDGDEIVVAPGAYFERIDFVGKAITLRSSGGPQITIIDGEEGGTVVTCTSGEGPDTVLEGFTITHGKAARGGGMWNEAADPTVIKCTFEYNFANMQGGGMYNDGSSPTVAGCSFIGNTAGSGGGMYNRAGSNPTVTDSMFRVNGGVGGGMRNNESSPVVTRCSFISNSIGMYNADSSNPTVSNCLFAQNTAASSYGGAGVHNDGSHPLLANCTFAGNLTTGLGGAIANSVDNFGDPSFALIVNCVLWGDTPDEILNGRGSFATVRYSDVAGSWPGLGNVDTDPFFVDPEGGDYHLRPCSPVVNAGDPDFVPEPGETDIDGDPRVIDGRVDMGADEVAEPGTPVVGDLDADCLVGISDLLLLLIAWGPCAECDDCPADLDDDCAVGIVDILILLGNWG